MQRYIPVTHTRPKPPRVWLFFFYFLFFLFFCKQDTKERYWGQQFCQMERDISVGLTDLLSWSIIFRSDQTEMVRSI